MNDTAKKYWLQISIESTFAQSSQIEEYLIKQKALCTKIVDLSLSDRIELLDGDLVKVEGLFLPSVVQKDIDQQLNTLGYNTSWQKIYDQDWQEQFNASCTTFKLEHDIYIVPSFEVKDFIKNNPSKLFIQMEPHNAFGSGHHQTTQLCLNAIYEYLAFKNSDWKNSVNCLDIGTGSGILAILMAKMGACNILATENDETALNTALENLHNNQVAAFVMQVDEDYQYKENAFDLIVANILANVLHSLSTNIFKALRKNGRLIISGILQNQAKDLQEHFVSLGLVFISCKSMDAWVVLEFSKTN